MTKATQMPEVRDWLTAIGFDVATSTPDNFARYIQSEVIKWQKLARQMGLKAG